MMGTDATWTAEAQAEAPVDPEQLLIEELTRVRDDRSLLSQIARLVQLSRELRSRRYTGQVTLHLGNGLFNSAQHPGASLLDRHPLHFLSATSTLTRFKVFACPFVSSDVRLIDHWPGWQLSSLRSWTGHP
jgi:hypothetical protein